MQARCMTPALRKGLTKLRRFPHLKFERNKSAISYLSKNYCTFPELNLENFYFTPKFSKYHKRLETDFSSLITNQKRNKVFVSKYNQLVTADDIISFCQQNGISADKTKKTYSHVCLEECPFCKKPTNGKIDNLYKIYIKIGSGVYFCHRCGEKGSWFDFKKFFNKFSILSSSLSQTPKDGLKHLPLPETDAHRRYAFNLKKGENKHVLDYLMSVRGIEMKTLEMYGVGVAKYKFQDDSGWKNADCITFPWICKVSDIREQEELRGATFEWERMNKIEKPVDEQISEESIEIPDKIISDGWMAQYEDLLAFFSENGHCNVPKNHANTKLREWMNDQRKNYIYFEQGKHSTLGKDHVKRLNKIGFCWSFVEHEDTNSSSPAELLSEMGMKITDKKISKIWKEQFDELLKFYRDEGHCNIPKSYGNSKLAKWVDDQRSNYNDLVSGKKSLLGKTHIEMLEKIGFHWKLPRQVNINSVPESRKKKEENPWITRRIKARALCNKGWQKLDPAGGGWGLFGWNTIPSDTKEIIITEGEYDAMAVYQATGRAAVSLPNGCRNLPQEVLLMLERFEKIYLWTDNDAPGREAAKSFSQKLGISRCFIVDPASSSFDSDDEAPKDANEALLKRMNLEAFVKKAKISQHENIVSLRDVMPDVMHEIQNPHEYVGDAMKSLPALNNIIKGFRPGEMTVFSGSTGSGKTTFLCQTSLDFALQNLNVLWGSFEIRNSRLISKLFNQYQGKPLLSADEKTNPELTEVYKYITSKFMELPLYFMTFHGASDVDRVLEAMEYGVYLYDVKHIFLDNLQFMLSREARSSNFDKYDVQDIAIEKFRKFATEKNVHITLVVHPRKEEEGSKLGINSIYGSAKATQEADTVMILQSEGNRSKYIEVKKNRYDGELGSCPLHFDKTSSTYFDTPLSNKVGGLGNAGRSRIQVNHSEDNN